MSFITGVERPARVRSFWLWIAALLALFVFIGSLWYGSTRLDLPGQLQKRDTIASLRELPLGQVKVRGAVTYVDAAGKRFWVQDETGAIAIDQDPGLTETHFGDLVQVEMKKAHAFDSAAGFKSLGLTGFKVTRSTRRASLPNAPKLSIPSLAKDEDGIRVSVEGVLHSAVRTEHGLVQIAIGDDGQEVEASLPGDAHQIESWTDARVRITGVLEVLPNPGWSLPTRIIWAQNRADLEKISEPPVAIALSSVRSIYAGHQHVGAQLTRIRGRVLYQESPGLMYVEADSGVVGCVLEQPEAVAAGTAVEVRGFLKKDGLRIDFTHATVFRLKPGEEPGTLSADHVSTIASVRALPDNLIRTAPLVKVTGVITYIDAELRQLFLQDETAGIFLKYAGTPVSLHQGERVTVIGMAREGDFAPVIVVPKFIPIGPAPMPKPVSMNLRAAYGAFDCLYGEVEGVVHPSRELQFPDHTSFYLYSALGPIHVDADEDLKADSTMANLQDATVRVRGVVGEIFNSRKQLIGLQLTISSAKQIEIIEPGSANPFAQSATSISDLLKFAPESRPDHRAVVSGVVTMLGNGFFYIQDRTGGVRIESDTSGIQLHDAVDAAGYAAATGYSPVLTDAVVRVIRKATAIAPKPVTADMMSDGQFDSQLVSVDARLLSIENSAGSRTLSIDSGGHSYQAVLYLMDTGQPFAPPQDGSLLRLTGICSVLVGRDRTGDLFKKEPVTFKLMIRSPADIQVLSGGRWWTLGRSLVVTGILVLIVLLSAVWIIGLRRRIDRNIAELRKASAKEDAMRQLIGAMQAVRVNKEFTSQVSLPEAGELAMLGAEFNHMVEELRVRDIAMAEAEAKLQQQALTDALTGLPNRRLLSDRLSQSVATAKRSGGMVAVLFIDLDGFKLVNDSFGHNFGDLLLMQVAKRIATRIRKSDTLSRLGGDEFAVVLNSLREIGHAEAFAHTLLREIGKPFEIEGHEITIGASIGVCVYPDHANDDAELLRFADSAMYAAKRSGKNLVVLFTKDLGESVRERLTLENQLRRAIDEDKIEVHYQPEFDMESGHLIRFEALARWTHPTLGSIPPSKFIPVAEESGLIVQLGAAVMERACAECVRWQAASDTPIEVAVNVSNVQFSRDTFVEEVEAILKKAGMRPNLLQLELTESVMMIGLEKTVSRIKELQALGVTVAIDDFGTGYSALSYIPELPFDALKIDRTFMKEIMHRSEAKAMVRSLVVLAQELGMNVIVEGIENQAQLAAIKEIGADAVQGFLLGYPTADPGALLSRSASGEQKTRLRDKETTVPEKVQSVIYGG